jgi:hypothetical protein
VDDERELMGHKWTSITDEELWQVVLQAKDGVNYEVNSKLFVPGSLLVRPLSLPGSPFRRLPQLTARTFGAKKD